MKYLDNSEMTVATRRTLKNLREALQDLLKLKPIEKISIQELCHIAMISRGTFYNYFYDKYDLLNYDWTQIQLEIDPEFANPNLKYDKYDEYMNILLENLIRYLSKERELYQKIVITNSNSIFSENMHNFIEEQILLKLSEDMDNKKTCKIPIELLATIYANTIITVGIWWLKHGIDYTEEDVYRFFSILIDHDIVLNESD